MFHKQEGGDQSDIKVTSHERTTFRPHLIPVRIILCYVLNDSSSCEHDLYPPWTQRKRMGGTHTGRCQFGDSAWLAAEREFCFVTE